MMRRVFLSVGCLLALVCGIALAQPATAPSSPEFSVTPMRVQTLAGAEAFAYREAETTLATVRQTVDQLMKPLDEAFESGKLRPTGNYTFVYQDATGDPEQPFKIQVGRPVASVSQPPQDISIRKLDAIKAATVVYSGSLDNIHQGYGQLMNQIFPAGLTPTGETREIYCYWEGPDSPNNVIILQAAVR